MRTITTRILPCILPIALAASIMPHCYAGATVEQSPAEQTTPSVSKAIGAIKSLTGTTIALTPDSGPDVNIVVQPAAQIVRIEPGAKSLSDAAPITLQDLQVGDRIRVTGKLSDDGHTLLAGKIIAIKHADLEARHQLELQDWQKRGVDGLATAVDPAAGTVTITVRTKPVVVHTSNATVVRRYPPDSVKFDDARTSTLQAIHPGDQIRARGTRSADGSELAADEIVSGAFRNIAGTINSVDASSSIISVHDLLAKKNLDFKITADSQLRKLPPEMAQRIAMRFKGRAGGNASGSSAAAPNAASAEHQRPSGEAAGSGAPGSNPRGAPDLQQMLSHVPTITLSDLHKGDAVVLVSTEGNAGGGTAITLLSGVEPILQAAPGASSSSILSPWSLSAPAGDAGGP
jgi:hypothetical protein